MVIERMPLPPGIGRLNDLEFFFGKKFGIHLRNRRIKSNRLGFEIGGRAEAHIR
jgi:hypothetical protein